MEKMGGTIRRITRECTENVRGMCRSYNGITEVIYEGESL